MRKSQIIITLAVVAAFIGIIIALAGEAKASSPADLNDVRYMTSVGKAAWVDLDSSSQNDICTLFFIDPYFTRNELARTMYNGVFEREYSLYDTRRAAWRILNWAC